MRNTSRGSAHFLSVAILSVVLLPYPTLVPLAAHPVQTEERPDVSRLLEQARDKAAELSRDADEMESFTRTNVSYESHSEKINSIRDHVNYMGKLTEKMMAARDSAAPWQQQAIDRMVPLLKELAAHTTAAINHLKQNPTQPNTGPYKEYLELNAETAHQLADMVSSFVKYGETRARMEKLEQKLEVASR